MKYSIEQSFARYENGNLIECRFVVKNKQGKRSKSAKVKTMK